MRTERLSFTCPTPQQLAARRQAICGAAIAALNDCFRWQPGQPLEDHFVDSVPATPDKRCRFSMALAYLAGNEPQFQKGAALLDATDLPLFCNHSVALLATILKIHGARLPSATCQRLLERLARYAADAGTEDFRVQGFNDNAPLHCMATLLFAGDLLGNHSLTELGLQRLREAVAMLHRRGCLGEMNSPTYTAWSVTPMACVANWCDNTEAKELALLVEKTLITEALLLYHRDLRLAVAPFSRAYSDDLDAHLTDVQLLLSFWLGADAPWSMADALQPDQRLRTHGTWQFFIAMMPYKVTPDYHFDAELFDALNAADYPLEVRGSCEHGSLGGGHVNAMPGGCSPFYSYRTDWLGMGSFLCRGWPETHLHAAYQRRAIPPGARGTQLLECERTLYYAGRADDEPLFSSPRETEMDQHQRTAFLRRGNHSAAVVLQDKQRAILSHCLHPPPDQRVCTVGLSIILPAFFAEADEIWADDQRLTGGVGTFTHYPTIHIRDGQSFIRIIPLVLPHNNTHHLRAMGVERYEHYQMICCYNLTTFTPAPPPGDGCWHNGFFIEFGCERDDDSFESFRARRSRIRVEDSLGYARERRLRVSGPDFDLGLAVDTLAATVRYATVNGEERTEKRLVTSAPALNHYLDRLRSSPAAARATSAC